MSAWPSGRYSGSGLQFGAAGIMLGAMSGDGKGGGPVRRPRVIERPRVPPGPLADLKALIYELYLQAGTPILDEMAAWVAGDDELAGAPGRDSIHRVIGDAGLPPSQADVVAVVSVLARAARWDRDDAAGRARDLWVAARMDSARAPAGGVRVSEADLRRLGVHVAISAAGVSDEVPPEYVPRDVDADEHGVRAKVAAAALRGGFVLLVGGSSVGKTRCAAEAVRALLPDWWLVHPAGPDQVVALAQVPSPQTVVWLDELQRYLDGEQGLTGAVVRALLNPPHPAVVIATLWPDWYIAYTALRGSGGADMCAREREVLDLATVVHIGLEFSPAEQGRARAVAARDPRLKVALESVGYGLTQTLAAAPQLVARWENARTAAPYARAVLTAALDAARLGARAPLSADLLRAAAPGYCTGQQQAEAPGNWFEQAMAYATEKLHGAAAALTPAGTGMGLVAGYTVADYLIQHASRERRYARVPSSTWDAILNHLRDPDDTARLAGSARSRLLYRYAISLSRHAADFGDAYAARQLADLLARRGDLDGLRARADHDGEAARQLAELLEERGDLDEAGKILRARADGDGEAAWQLAELLEERGDLDEAEHMLRAAVAAGHESATDLMVYLLEDSGDLDEAEHMLRAAVAAGHEYPALMVLAGLLERHGDPDEAEQILRARADGDGDAAQHLAGLLERRGDLDGLRARADAGDSHAVWRLNGLLAKRGDLDGLRARAGAGDRNAIWRLAELLEELGNVDEAEQIMRTQAEVGDGGDYGEYAARKLAELLAEQGRGEEAERLRRFGLNPDGSTASA
jgi:hypothetical protein